MESKRKHKRKNITATALIRPLKGEASKRPFNVLVLNVSLGGAEVGSTESLIPGDEFEAVLWFIDNKGVVAGGETVQGTVRWEKKMPPFHMFGLQFSGVNAKEHPELLNYIESKEE